MESWKAGLFDRYLSTGQAPAPAAVPVPQGQPYLRRMIARHVPPGPGLRIADLGCGSGALVWCLRAAGYANVVGVDISGEQVAAARRLGIEGIAHGDLFEFLAPRRSTFDVVFLMDVIEHLAKPQICALLAAVRAALHPGGRVIIHAPNGAGPNGMRILYGDFTHETGFTDQSVRQILRAAGFEHIEVHEDAPTLHNAKGMLRFFLWHLLTLPRRLLLFAETGVLRHVLSQNLLVVAHAAPESQVSA
jgi:SAM-dependent methyltransferase